MELLVLLFVALLMLLVAGVAMLLHGLAYPPRMTVGVAMARELPTDPADLELTATEHIFQLPDGSRTPAWLIAGHRSDGPTIVLSHGYGDARFGMLPVVPDLTPYARNVVVYDLRGQGQATSRRSAGGLREPQDLLAILDQIEAIAPGSTAGGFVLMGFSMGAGISLVAAVRDAQAGRDRVRGVIGEGIYAAWDEPLLGLLRQWRWPARPLTWTAGWVLRLTQRGFSQFDRRRHANQLPCPLLLLHGEADAICPLASAQAIAAAAPDATLVTFPDAGHVGLAASDPQRYAQTLAVWLAGLAGPQTPIPPQENTP